MCLIGMCISCLVFRPPGEGGVDGSSGLVCCVSIGGCLGVVVRIGCLDGGFGRGGSDGSCGRLRGKSLSSVCRGNGCACGGWGSWFWLKSRSDCCRWALHEGTAPGEVEGDVEPTEDGGEGVWERAE